MHIFFSIILLNCVGLGAIVAQSFCSYFITMYAYNNYKNNPFTDDTTYGWNFIFFWIVTIYSYLYTVISFLIQMQCNVMTFNNTIIKFRNKKWKIIFFFLIMSALTVSIGWLPAIALFPSTAWIHIKMISKLFVGCAVLFIPCSLFSSISFIISYVIGNVIYTKNNQYICITETASIDNLPIYNERPVIHNLYVPI